jgi:hypothetical protein
MKAMSVICVVLLAVAALAQNPVPVAGVYALEQFGPVKTVAEAQATLRKASAWLVAQGGGVLTIPREAPATWQPEPIAQEAWRTPKPPAPAKQWGYGPGVTILDGRTGTLKVTVPQMTGFTFSRLLKMPDGQSANHWDYHPMVQMDNSIIRGTTSYHDWVKSGVKAGKDQRIYVNTLRGLFPGMFANNLGGAVNRLYIKSLGYDTEKQMPYVVADVDTDIPDGALLSNKTHANVLRMDTYSHTENQTFDVMVNRYNYSQGDNYMFHAGFNYMGDVHSTAGDENGVMYAAFAHSLTNVFRGTVEAFGPKSAELKYKGSNAHTLGTGRPMINLNPKKWITGGNVLIVRPGSWWEIAPYVKDPVFQGKGYPTQLVADASTGGRTELRMGGLIRFAKDAPVTKDVVGRYFAVNEPKEYVPGAGSLRRWYLIHSFTQNADGTKDIQIVRHWWGAKPAGAPTLYRPEHYSEDGRIVPLQYVIAPGANVYDVARGVADDGEWGGKYVSGALDRIVKVAPGPHSGTAADYTPGDAIEQAIGPDPFKPIPFRAWLFEQVPGAFPAPVFDIANHGATMRHSVLTVAGGPGALAECAQRADGSPAWDNIITINAACNEGIVFAGDTADAAIAFYQPNSRPQPITWYYDGQKKTASLTVSPKDGAFRFDGTGISLPGGLVNVGGLSGTTVKAQNLRGVNVPVPAGAAEFSVKFPKAESDDNYAVFLEFTWMTNRAITNRTRTGFTVQFAAPPPAEATLCWMIVR